MLDIDKARSLRTLYRCVPHNQPGIVKIVSRPSPMVLIKNYVSWTRLGSAMKNLHFWFSRCQHRHWVKTLSLNWSRVWAGSMEQASWKTFCDGSRTCWKKCNRESRQIVVSKMSRSDIILSSVSNQEEKKCFQCFSWWIGWLADRCDQLGSFVVFYLRRLTFTEQLND